MNTGEGCYHVVVHFEQLQPNSILRTRCDVTLTRFRTDQLGPVSRQDQESVSLKLGPSRQTPWKQRRQSRVHSSLYASLVELHLFGLCTQIQQELDNSFRAQHYSRTLFGAWIVTNLAGTPKRKKILWADMLPLLSEHMHLL